MEEETQLNSQDERESSKQAGKKGAFSDEQLSSSCKS